MEITAIVLLIAVGLLLILLEILVIPGTTVVGIGGLVMVVAGIYFAYSTYGMAGGTYTLGGVIVVSAFTLYFALKSKTWKKMSLKDNIDGKVNEFDTTKIKPGDQGVTITRLAPMGKIMVNNEYYEAKTQNNFIDQNTQVEIYRIEDNQIIVKPLN